MFKVIFSSFLDHIQIPFNNMAQLCSTSKACLVDGIDKTMESQPGLVPPVRIQIHTDPTFLLWFLPPVPAATSCSGAGAGSGAGAVAVSRSRCGVGV